MGAANTRPQLFAWNMGTTMSMVLPPLKSRVSGMAMTKAWRKFERWEYSTPFGGPVVPEV